MKKYTFADIINKRGIYVDGDWIESKDQDPKGDIRLIQLADIGDGYFIDKSKRYLTSQKAKELKCTFLQKGDVLLARMPDPLGRACIFPGLNIKCVTAVDVCIIRPDPTIVNPKWLMYLINSHDFRGKMSKYITGTTRQRISRGNLSKITFNVPSLKKQNKIVSILDKTDTFRQKRKQTITLLDEYIRSVFLEMFGDPIKNPRNYPMKSMVDIAIKDKNGIKAGPFGSSLKKEFYVKSGYKIYGQEQVIRGDLNYGDYFINSVRFNALKSCKIQQGDVLISLVGTYGKISVVPDKFKPGIINPRLMKISPNQTIIIPLFLKELLSNDSVQSQIKSLSHGGTMDIVNVGIIKKLKVIVPKIDEQKKYLCLKDRIEKLKGKMFIQSKELDVQFQSLMQKAFKGKL